MEVKIRGEKVIVVNDMKIAGINFDRKQSGKKHIVKEVEPSCHDSITS
jgi:hypothetical protein